MNGSNYRTFDGPGDAESEVWVGWREVGSADDLVFSVEITLKRGFHVGPGGLGADDEPIQVIEVTVRDTCDAEGELLAQAFATAARWIRATTRTRR